MRPVRSALFLAALAGPSALATAGDTVAPGYHIESELRIPLYASFASLPYGGILLFDGLDVSAKFPPDHWQAWFGSTPAFVYPSFVLPHPTQSHALLGESSDGQILRTDFVSGSLAPVAQIPLHFDAVWEDSGHILVSAAPCMLICGNEILRVDASTGAQTLVAQVSGPSGPLARSAAGDLFYGRQATTYPPPPNSMSILRWSAAQVESGDLLTEADAEVVVAGLDGIGSIEIDPVRGHLWVAESRWPGGSEIREYRLDGLPLGQVVASSSWIANLDITDLVPGPASGRAHRYGAPLVLRYVSIDYNPPESSVLVTVISDPINVPPAHR